MSSTTNKNVCKTDESSCLFLSYACYLSLLCVSLHLWAWLLALVRITVTIVSATLCPCERDPSLLCVWLFELVYVIFHLFVHDFFGRTSAWLFALVWLTLRSCVRDSSLSCDWLFELVCVIFHIFVRDFFWRVRKLSVMLLGLIYPCCEFNREIFNLSTQITCRGHIFFYIFWLLSPPLWWLVLNARQKSVFLVWLSMVSSSK